VPNCCVLEVEKTVTWAGKIRLSTMFCVDDLKIYLDSSDDKIEVMVNLVIQCHKPLLKYMII